MKKQNVQLMPSLKNDEDALRFTDNSDLSAYDLSGFLPAKFEFELKTASINMRLPQALLAAVKIKAQAEGMPYSRYIRHVLEQAVAAHVEQD